MRTLLSICGLLAIFAALGLAETWTGVLIDQTCYSQHKSANGCAATVSTTSFGLNASGQVYGFDANGNSKAAELMKVRADRSADEDNPATGPIAAKVTGSRNDDVIAVDTITLEQ